MIVRLICAGLMLGLGVACGEENPESAQTEPGTSASAPPQPADRRPNVVLITMDTTRADAIGAYGQSEPTSPALDRVAATGTLFEEVTTSNPETLPAHATIFTGQWPFVHGVRANSGYVLADENRTLAEILRNEGYVTGAQVAATVMGSSTQIAQGFDDYRDADSPGVRHKKIQLRQGPIRTVTKKVRVAADITASEVAFARRHVGTPFFLWLHYFDPHDPYYAPPPFSLRITNSRYHAEVAHMDFQIGAFLVELGKLGLADRTLVVLTADHGEGLGEHGEPTHSSLVYQSVMRAPLILAGIDAVKTGRRIRWPVRTIDIAPTVLDLLDVEIPASMQGQSLLPLLAANAEDPRLIAYGESQRFRAVFGMPTLRFLRQGRWKYIHKVAPELYDLERDPDELVNLASKRPDVVERLRGQLARMLERAPPSPADAAAPVSEQRTKELVALGYVATSGEPAGQASDPLELHGPDPNTRLYEIDLLSDAHALILHRQYDEAVAIIEPILERSPDSPYAMSLLATAQKGAGRHAEALVVLEQILHRQPCDTQARFAMNGLLKKRDARPKILVALASGVEQCPDSPWIHNDYAWMLATAPEDELRDGEEALRVIRAVIKALDRDDPVYLDTLAAALAETGDFPEAEAVQQRVVAGLSAQAAPAPVIRDARSRLDGYGAGLPARQSATQ